MINNNNKFSTYEAAFRSFSSFEFVDKAQASGTMLLNDVALQVLENLDELDRIIEIEIGDARFDYYQDQVRGYIDQEAIVTFSFPQLDPFYVARDINDLLSVSLHLHKAPENYLVVSALTDPEESSLLEIYKQTLRLVDILCRAADHCDPNGVNEKFIYLGTKKVEIPIVYSRGDLKEIEGLDDFDTFLSVPPHLDQKLAIFKSGLQDFLVDTKSEERFVRLIHLFPQFLERIQSDFNVYASELTFDKVRDEIEKRKLDFVDRLNKVFSDIQNKILAVPIAQIVAAGQMKPDEDFKNTVIFIGVILFTILMDIMIRNQADAITAIGTEIDRQQADIKEKYPQFELNFKEIFNYLSVRERTQKHRLNLVSAIIAFSILFSASVFMQSSIYDFCTPIKIYFIEIISVLCSSPP